MGLGHMFQGGSDACNTDPHAAGPAPGDAWLETGPHVLIFPVDAATLASTSTDCRSGAAYVMWQGTSCAHVMMPGQEQDDTGYRLRQQPGADSPAPSLQPNILLGSSGRIRPPLRPCRCDGLAELRVQSGTLSTDITVRTVFLPFALLAALATPAGAQGPVPDEAVLARRLDTTLDSLDRAGRFSGVVILGRNGLPVYQRAVGFENREAGRRNQPGTRFNLGSINKAFTAAAIRQLAADGTIALDSPLVRAWPDYPNIAVARAVTIRQLLQHRSGIGGNIFGTPAGGTRADLRHNNDFLQLFVDEPLQFEPGTDQRYSNAGYVVLGMLIERLSGEDYYDYVRRHIYQPAGMTATAHTPLADLAPGTAIGYTRGDPGTASPDAALSRNTRFLPGRGSAAGGGYSNAADLLRYVQALRESRIPGGTPPGIGVAGGAPGTNAVLDGDLPGGYDLVVLANLDPPAAEHLARTIRGWLGAND
jgi:D-alanyl-D-alanine carboxypeptidase